MLRAQRSFAADYERYAGLKLLPLLGPTQPIRRLELPSQQQSNGAKSPRREFWKRRACFDAESSSPNSPFFLVPRPAH